MFKIQLLKSAGRTTLHCPAECVEYRTNLLVERLMLPDSNDPPAAGREQGVGVLVALPVPRQLQLPPLRVVLGRYTVLRAAVPKTTVHEHRHTQPGEGYVDRPTRSARDRNTYSIPQTATMQRPAKVNLRLGIASRLVLHVTPNHIIERLRTLATRH